VEFLVGPRVGFTWRVFWVSFFLRVGHFFFLVLCFIDARKPQVQGTKNPKKQTTKKNPKNPKQNPFTKGASWGFVGVWFPWLGVFPRSPVLLVLSRRLSFLAPLLSLPFLLYPCRKQHTAFFFQPTPPMPILVTPFWANLAAF